MNVSTNNYQSGEPISPKSNQPAFKGGNLGREIVDNLSAGKDIKPEEILDACKGKFGLNTEKVQDVLDALKSRATALIHSDQNLNTLIEEKQTDIAKKVSEQSQLAERTEKEATKRLEEYFQSRETAIAGKEAKIKELNEFSAQYKALTPITLEEARVLTPQETIESIKSMSGAAKEAHEDMLNFLFTGKGGEKAVKYVNQGTELYKAELGGVFNDTDVKKVSEEFKHIVCISGTETMLMELIKESLIVDPKGAYLNAEPIRKQVAKNALAIINPISKDSKATAEYLDEMLKRIAKIHMDISNVKKSLSSDKTYKFEPNNYRDAQVILYLKGQPFRSGPYEWFATINK